MKQRLFLKITKEMLPQIKDKLPFVYLEHGKLLVENNSITWRDLQNEISIPCATINCILLGPATSITHDAVKILSDCNCSIIWVSEDSTKCFASSITPTANTRNLQKQLKLAFDPIKSVEIARKLFNIRFDKIDSSDKTVKELMGIEGFKMKELYEKTANKYEIIWRNRETDFFKSDTVNKNITIANQILYGIISSCIHSLGFSPHIGFFHVGSPLPFVYDLSDLYKEFYSIDLGFFLIEETNNIFDREKVYEEVKKRAIENNLLEQIIEDIKYLFEKEEK